MMITIDAFNKWVANYSAVEPNQAFFNEFVEFEDFNDVLKECYINLTSLCKDDPQVIVDLLRHHFKNNHELILLLRSLFTRNVQYEEEDNLDKHLSMIAIFWEAKNLFKLFTILLSGNRLAVTNNSVLKNGHFKSLDFSTQEFDQLRKFRNAQNHSYTIRGNEIIDDDNQSAGTFDEAKALYDKTMNLTRTWLYFLLGCMITNPSFVQLIIYTGNNVYNEDPQNFKSLFRTIYTFKKVDKSKSSEPTEQYEVPVEEPPLLAKWITSAWKFIKNPKAAMDRRTIKTLLENSFNNDEPLISNDRVIEFLELAKSKVAEFADQMLVNSADLNEVTDQENMAKLAVTIKQWASSDRAEIEDFSASSLDFLKEQMVKPIHSEEE